MRADVLCSSSKGNSTLVRTEGGCILIDCGSTKRHLSDSLKALDVSVDAVDAVLITHGHSDHISQLKMFADRPVYSCCPLDCDKTQIEPGDRFSIGPFHITVIGLSHDAAGTVGFVIRDASSKLVYITDTGFVPNAAKPLLENGDAYIFESNHDVQMLLNTNRPLFLKQRILGDSGHLCNEDSAMLLSQLAGPATKHIVLAHLSDQANTPELALKAFHEGFKKRGVDDRHIDVRAAAPRRITTIEKF